MKWERGCLQNQREHLKHALESFHQQNLQNDGTLVEAVAAAAGVSLWASCM